jgi:flagellar hook assembly protein FlgD
MEEKTTGSAAHVLFRPTLEDGFHTLDVVARDATQNLSTAHLEFRVISRFQIRDLLNFPNPTAGATDFTYTLTQPAEAVSLGIYTLSGRKIFSRGDLPAEAGPNVFHWDGTDAEGDPLANGVYLIRLTARHAGKTFSTIGKIILLR